MSRISCDAHPFFIARGANAPVDEIRHKDICREAMTKRFSRARASARYHSVTMFERVPTWLWVIAVIGVLLSGPVTVYSFWLAGPGAGAIAILAIVFLFVVL